MFEAARQLHFTRSLERLSARFDELLMSAYSHHQHVPAELIDEIAFTAGELMLVLTNHHSNQEETSDGDIAVKEVLSHAGSLRQRLRADLIKADQMAADCASFGREVARLVAHRKQAA